MSCERYHDALTDVAAGGPAPAGLEVHLASCETCREELASLRQGLVIADAEMARLAADEPSPGLAARIRQAVAARDAAPAWRFGWVWPATATAAALLVVLATWLARAPSPEPRVAVGSRPGVTAGESRPAEGGSRTGEPPERAAPSPSPRARGLGAGAGPATPKAAGSSVSREVARAGGSLGTRRGGVPRDGMPEVLVPRGEAEALVRFAAIVHRDRHTPGAFATAGRPSADLAEPAALEIEPLEIVPLDPAENPGT
jgi:hypothetical protein